MVWANRPFAASHSRGTKPPCWRTKVALGQDKQRKLQFRIMYVPCLSCLSAAFALQRGGFVLREWLAAKGLLAARKKNNELLEAQNLNIDSICFSRKQNNSSVNIFLFETLHITPRRHIFLTHGYYF